jgi:hypothetical protein
LIFFPPRFIFFVGFEDKGPPVPAVLADIDLANISPGNGKDIPAFTDRTREHTQQLYMNIRYKN